MFQIFLSYMCYKVVCKISEEKEHVNIKFISILLHIEVTNFIRYY